jgi:hypothetical protein
MQYSPIPGGFKCAVQDITAQKLYEITELKRKFALLRTEQVKLCAKLSLDRSISPLMQIGHLHDKCLVSEAVIKRSRVQSITLFNRLQREYEYSGFSSELSHAMVKRFGLLSSMR